MEFFGTLQKIRVETNLASKLALLDALDQALQEGRVTFAHDSPIEPVGNPSYAAFCRIVHGSQVERRRNLDTAQGRGIFLHALAHIEYSAIDLALDTCYRFRNLPPQYYEDFFAVACDEARHFTMLQSLLQELGFSYGSFTVHTGIHDAMVRSAHSLRVRMAATHRHLEAGGLDAHPELVRKIALFEDEFARKITNSLKIIFTDEIRHVTAGDFWFRYACGLDQVGTDIFVADVSAAIPGTRFPRVQINWQARLHAGFTAAELEFLTTKAERA